MSKFVKLTTPLSEKDVEGLKAGDHIELTGIIYTARDAAHKRLIDTLSKKEQLPFDIRGQVIYYAGPAPARPGMPIGPVGPTTSYRMDPFAPRLMMEGLKGMIGKGNRSREVIDALMKYKCVYFAAMGGAAALIAKSVKRAEVVAYDDLGTEAIRKLEVENFQAVVVNDMYGNDLYEEGKKKYACA